jgi:hypothetical protein
MFELIPWLHHSIVFLLPAFSLTWFKAIRSVSNPMSSDGVEQPIIECSAARRAAVILRGDQRLKGFQRLNCALEADRSWLDAVFCCSLSDDRADEIVSNNVRPDLLSHQLWRPATQDVHLHGLLERSQIKFGVPASAIELSKVAGAYLLHVEQRGHDDQLAAAESRLPNQYSCLANSEGLW